LPRKTVYDLLSLNSEKVCRHMGRRVKNGGLADQQVGKGEGKEKNGNGQGGGGMNYLDLPQLGSVGRKGRGRGEG